MQQTQHAATKRFGLALRVGMVVAIIVLLPAACSLMLDTNTIQCQRDQDCQRFAGTLCDLPHHVCVPSRDAGASISGVDAATDAVESCIGPGGCFLCIASSESQILSHCTDSTCVPFDNNRLTLLGDNGALRPLPP